MQENPAVAMPAAMVPQDFGAQQMVPTGETTSTAVAAQVQAAIQARYVMALKRPRDLFQVRAQLLKECQRPGFAESAMYAKPVGGKAVTGLSVRFAEAAIRCMTNMAVEVMSIYDDPKKKITRVTVTDTEANVPYALDLTIEKTVERSKVATNQPYISVRINSYGKPTYLVEATEGDLVVKENALISKAVRTLALRHLPGDIQDECKAAINTTLTNKAAQDPDAERKKLLDAFATLRVEPKDLTEYLGHDVGKIVPAELVELRQVYSAIKAGEATWVQVLADKLGAGSDDEAQEPEQPTSRAAAAKARAKAAAEAVGESPPA